MLLTLLCCVGQIVLIVFWVQRSEPIENQYGITAI